ncbi:MAG: glycosyltransferase [Candidatus Saccharibacteria bacterium]|nr:glycosyltransferase [Candidatus Saccharibacteria bacterium]
MPTRRPKVTVVVPVYKVEKYLRECVDSILRQTLKNIEVILIDDGSPDDCGQIIDEYAKADKRVVAVHQENSGYSKAVNRGIEMARGEYIGIIESDDWIEPDMYETLYNDAKKNRTDVTKGMFYFYNSTVLAGAQNSVFRNPSNVDLRLAPSGVFQAKEWPKLIAFHASIWSAIYRADFIKKIPIPESAGASYQDFPFMMQFLTKAKRITVVKRPFVHWRNDPEQGNSSSARGEKLLLMAQNSKLSLEIAHKYKDYDKIREAVFIQILWANLSFFEREGFRLRGAYYKLLREIFSEIAGDPTFKFQYFSKHDKDMVKYFLVKNGRAKYEVHRFFHRIRSALHKFARTFFPTYRTVTYLKWQNWEMEHQLEMMSEEIQAIRKQLEK